MYIIYMFIHMYVCKTDLSLLTGSVVTVCICGAIANPH